jgi:hypothetical protein
MKTDRGRGYGDGTVYEWGVWEVEVEVDQRYEGRR